MKKVRKLTFSLKFQMFSETEVNFETGSKMKWINRFIRINLFHSKEGLKLMVVALVLWACSLTYSAYFAIFDGLHDRLHNRNTQYWPIYFCILTIVASLYFLAVFSYFFVWQFIASTSIKETNHPLTNVLNNIQRRDSKYFKQQATAVILWKSPNWNHWNCLNWMHSIRFVNSVVDFLREFSRQFLSWIQSSICFEIVDTKRQIYSDRAPKAAHWDSSFVVLRSIRFHIHIFQMFSRFLRHTHTLRSPLLPEQMLWRAICVKCVQVIKTDKVLLVLFCYTK